MANGVSTVNTSKLKQFKSSFSKEKTTLKESYSNFKNSYLKKSEDVYIQKMAKSIDGIYEDIETAYSTILKWWSEYIENIEKVDRSLNQNSKTSNSKTNVNENTNKNDSNVYFNSLGFDNLFSATKTAVVEGEKKIIEKDKNRQELHDQLYEYDPELANSFDIVIKEHPEYDYERTLKKCMNDEGYANVIKQNAININEAEAKKAAEEYAKKHPIKSNIKKVGKACNNFFNATSEIAEDSMVNLGLMELNFFNGVESGVQNIETFFNKTSYSLGLKSEEKYLEKQDKIKKHQLIDDNILNEVIDEQGINDFGPSKIVNNVVGGLGESAIPILATMATGGSAAVLVGGTVGFVDGYGKTAKEATEHQKEFIDNQAVVLSQDTKEGTITYMYQGSKVVVDSTGEVISNEKMCSKEYYKVLAGYHDMAATDKAALLGGLWGGATFALGAGISKSILVTNPIVNSTIKIAIDGAFGGIEAPVQSAIKTTYMKFFYDENGNMVTVDEDFSFSDKYKKAFEENGGWDAVKQGAIMGASMSFAFGEASNIDAALNYKKMLSTNPKAFAESLIKQGLSEEVAYKAIKEISPNELISQKMKLDEHFKYNKDGSVNKVIEPEKVKKEINKIVDKASGKDVDFTIASDLKANASKAKQKISNISDNIKLKETFKLILADDSGKVDLDGFSKNKKTDINTMINEYNRITDIINVSETRINDAIEATLKKQNVEISPTNVATMKKLLDDGIYNCITNDYGWRDIVKGEFQRKEKLKLSQNELANSIENARMIDSQKNSFYNTNINNKSSNIYSIINEYNRITDIINVSETRINDAIEATLKKQNVEINPTNVATMKRLLDDGVYNCITNDYGWRDIVKSELQRKEKLKLSQKELEKSIYQNTNINNNSINSNSKINNKNLTPIDEFIENSKNVEDLYNLYVDEDKSNIISNSRNILLKYLDSKDCNIVYWNKNGDRYFTNLDINPDFTPKNAENYTWMNFKKGDGDKYPLGNSCKIYLPVEGNVSVNNMNYILDYLIKKNISFDNKICKYARNDGICLRIYDLKDAAKVIDFINSNNNIIVGNNHDLVFAKKYGKVHIAMDGECSYSNIATTMYKKYASFSDNNISKEGFKNYVDSIRKEVYINGNYNVLEDIVRSTGGKWERFGALQTEQIINRLQVLDVLSSALDDNSSIKDCFSVMKNNQNWKIYNELSAIIDGYHRR